MSAAAVLWEKSKENFIESENAYSNGHPNVAASRYYYVLVLASLAMLHKRDKIDYEWIDHPKLISDACNLFTQKKFHDLNDLLDAMELAWQLRCKADYEAYPVDPGDYECLLIECTGIWECLTLEFGAPK